VLGPSLNQREVDFVIPDLDSDVPLCIDPFLLFKSRRPELQGAHALLLSLFRDAFDAFRDGDLTSVRHMIDFPEVKEIRFGYSKGSIHGSGSGTALSTALIESLQGSPEYLDRGLRHVEELQLLTNGLVAEDRISDAAAGILKSFLVDYTASQCRLWDIPVESGVPLHHIWSSDDHSWIDGYVELPIDPNNRVPIILVPRWIVRRLPWINYSDYLRTDLSHFLGPRLRGSRQSIPKPRAVAMTRQRLDVMDSYIDRKEATAHLAQPDPPPLLGTQTPVCADLLERLLALPVGHAYAREYQRLALQVLNCLVEPELVDGQEQVRTASGVEIRDIVFANNSDLPFLKYLMTHYGNLLLVVELKNVKRLETDDVNQLANYLGDAVGRCGILMSRLPASAAVHAKIRATFGKLVPRRGIIAISDFDLRVMAEMKSGGRQHPVEHLRRKYRELVQSFE
jgi:hypothetical protein